MNRNDNNLSTGGVGLGGEALRPYEKFERYGAEALSEAELLAVILRTGTAELSAEQLAANILEEANYDNLGVVGLHNISLSRLRGIKGVGPVRAVQIKCLMEFCARVVSHRAQKEVTYTKPAAIAACYMERLRYNTRESVWLLMLDAKGHLIKDMEVSRGTVTCSLVSPRDIFIEALRYEAVHIILIHNHPSGDPTPSKLDLQITREVKTIGDFLDIPLLDHIIVGDNKYYSLVEQGDI